MDGYWNWPIDNGCEENQTTIRSKLPDNPMHSAYVPVLWIHPDCKDLNHCVQDINLDFIFNEVRRDVVVIVRTTYGKPHHGWKLKSLKQQTV